ncbi:MAG: hypothetical protein LBS19_06130 [Clostridiales bacterium]|jgi:hypothetical protein|nr:hypothetical protein [Clostridiales bacterium]
MERNFEGVLKALLKERSKGRKRAKIETEGRLFNTASHIFMAGVMLAYFAGAAVGVFKVLFQGAPLSTLFEYILELALPVGLGYFVKAFGENIFKIVTSAILQNVGRKAEKPPETPLPAAIVPIEQEPYPSEKGE